MSGMELPRWRCHKEVGAARIAEIRARDDGEYDIVFEDERIEPIAPGSEYFGRHNPESGGYFVEYVDGYMSYIPAAAFEQGYRAIEDAATS